jgi:hypothetical protein
MGRSFRCAVVAVASALIVAGSVSGCGGGSEPDDSTPDAGDAGTDGDSGTDDDFDAGNAECPEPNSYDVVDFSNDVSECMYAVAWADIPDSTPDPPYATLDKSCGSAGLLAYLPATSTVLCPVYSADCAGESPDDGVFAWRWAGIDAPASQLGEYTIDQCVEIELCPAACAAIADGVWSQLLLMLDY